MHTRARGLCVYAYGRSHPDRAQTKRANTYIDFCLFVETPKRIKIPQIHCFHLRLKICWKKIKGYITSSSFFLKATFPCGVSSSACPSIRRRWGGISSLNHRTCVLYIYFNSLAFILHQQATFTSYRSSGYQKTGGVRRTRKRRNWCVL